MRTVKLNGADIPIKANQAAKQKYNAEFGTPLTKDLLDLVNPLLQSGITDLDHIEDIDSATIVAMISSLDVDVQEILARIFWSCSWSADRTILDYDQWSEHVQDVDEAALALITDGGVADWVTQTIKAVAKAFLGVDLDIETASRTTTK